MTSSRIFVRGLPPNMSEDQFRKHFSSPFTVTDVKLIPQRRIGYVGYKSPEDATKAVKYFNKSYIRMSRIFVELARPVGSGILSKSEPNLQSQNGALNSNSDARIALTGSDNNRKRKRELENPPDSEPKLREFLEVMKPPSRSRTWADEYTLKEAGSENLEAAQQAPGNTSHNGQHTSAPVQHSGDIAQNAKKDNILSNANDSDMAAEEAQEEIDGPVSASPDDDDHAMVDRQTDNEAQTKATVSDTEWLRSRTSRLLGLVDDAEDIRLQRSVSPDEQKNPALRSRKLKVLPDPTTDEQADEDTRGKTASDPALSSDLPETDLKNGNCRLFVRNLLYSARESDLREQFSPYGKLTEVHVPMTANGTSKGFGYVSYADPESASRAYQELDGTSFQGRIMHVLPANTKVEKKVDEYALSKLPLKKQRQIRRKTDAASSMFNWNSLYMSTDAVMSSIADRLNVSKSDLLDPTSSDAAVRQAHAETHIIQETKDYFAANGVDLEAFHKHDRSDTAILVKNFPYGTKASEIKSIFEEYGHLTRILIPPAGTIAIVEFSEPSQARAAFSNLAYRRFKDSVLFLEKAPKGVLKSAAGNTTGDGNKGVVEAKPSTSDLLDTAAKEEIVDSTTLFIRNLNFSTSTARLTEICKAFDGFLSARVKTKPDPKRPGQTLSMGFGFLEFRSKQQAQSAASALDGYNLDGHKLLVRAAHRPLDAGEERRKEDMAKKAAGRNAKIIIKNLPFEASKKEVRSLFGSYGQLRSVRVPKKFDSSARGFAFAEFVTAREAENAMNALKHTHLLGRRLVLEFAAESAVDAEEELQRMQEKVGRQANRVTLQRLMGTGRQKFTVEEDNNMI